MNTERERDRTWSTCLYYGHGCSVLGFLGQGWIGQFKPDEQGLVSFFGVLSKGNEKGRPWEATGVVDQKGCLGSHIRNLFTCDSVGCCLGHVLA